MVPIRASVAVALGKRQLAQHLGRSQRWIELKVTEGMPSIPPTTRYPHRRFVLAEVEHWLQDGAQKRPSTAERLAALEVEVALLTRVVGELRIER